MGRKIGFTGPFSETNLGDYAMLVNTIYDVVNTDDRISLFTYNRPFAEKLAADYLDGYQVTTCGVQVMPEHGCASVIKWGLRKMGKWSDKKSVAVPIDLLNRLSNSEELYSEIARLDVMVVSGGGYFNQYWSCGERRDDLIAMLIPIIIANQFRKKIVFAGNTFGPFDRSGEFFFSLLQVLEDVTFGVRDNVYSRGSLLRLGVEPERISYVPDDLLFLNSRLAERQTGYQPPEHPYLVLELYHPVTFLQEYMSSLITFQEQMKQRYGVSVLFLPFDRKEGGMDQGRLLKRCCPELKLYDVERAGFLPVEDAVRLIRGAQLVVANRYHALVLAVGAGVPAIQVLKDVCSDKRYYYSKGYGVLKEVFRSIPFDEREYLKTSLPIALEEISKNYPLIRESQMKRYGGIYRKNMEDLRVLRQNYYRSQLGGGE